MIAGYYIDVNYFVGGINIPDTDSLETKGALELYIKKYESIFLTTLLGKDMYEDLLSATTFVDPITATGNWNKIINGDSFVNSNGDSAYFEGINGGDLSASGGFKRSPIANYVFWNFINERASITVGVGEVIPLVENGIRISPAYKMAAAWNEMVDLIFVLNDYVTINKANYPDYIGLKYPPFRYPSLRYPSRYRAHHCDLMPNQKLFLKQNPMGL